MGFRFRKRIKLFPGVSVNLSRSGVSTSVGRPGATINLGAKRGARVTVGIPGTGISYSESAGAAPRSSPDRPSSGIGFGALFLWGLAVLFVGLALYGIISG
jgi:hypothetical protein